MYFSPNLKFFALVQGGVMVRLDSVSCCVRPPDAMKDRQCSLVFQLVSSEAFSTFVLRQEAFNTGMYKMFQHLTGGVDLGSDQVKNKTFFRAVSPRGCFCSSGCSSSCTAPHAVGAGGAGSAAAGEGCAPAGAGSRAAKSAAAAASASASTGAAAGAPVRGGSGEGKKIY